MKEEERADAARSSLDSRAWTPDEGFAEGFRTVMGLNSGSSA
jgi:hypothetical protein